MWRHFKLMTFGCMLMISSASRAQVADFHQGILTVPEVIAGEVAFSAEFRLLEDSEPMRFELIASANISPTGSLLAATFHEGVLKIPEASVGGSTYWLEFKNTGNRLFTLTGWGELSPAPVTFSVNPAKLDPYWHQLPGFAYDVGIGANGDVWVIGTDPRPGGFGIYHLSRHGAFAVPGGALRIDVDPLGNPWIVNFYHEIYRWVDGYWQRIPGEALDVGIGADGSVWVASYEGVYLWNGLGWINYGGSGSRIDVGPNGQPWVVGMSDHIYTLVEGFWQELPGFAGDIGVGADGSVYVVAPAEFRFDGSEKLRSIFRWNGLDWDRVYGNAIDISVDPDGNPWVTNLYAELYRAL